MAFTETVWISAGAALTSVLAAVTLWYLGGQQKRSFQAQDRFRRAVEKSEQPFFKEEKSGLESKGFAFYENLLTRAGVSGRRFAYVVSALVAISLVLPLIGKAAWIPAYLAALALMSAGILYLMGEQQKDRIRKALPDFLSHLVRALGTGVSLQQAMHAVSQNAPEPLQGIIFRALRKLQLGMPLDLALNEAGRPFSLTEIAMIESAVRIHQRYGGNVIDLFESVARMIRDKERTRRELRALTAETRFSAWVLELLPIAIIIMISFVNPGYLSDMWSNPEGRKLIFGAGILQIIGAALMFRMVRVR